jgi:oligopeptide/dipeptide ABC transporter ATP-binding protein
MTAPLLRIEGLRVRLDGRDPPAYPVDGMDLAIEEGESVGLVGESGSGKTLCALSILRLLRPPTAIAGGKILFRGADLLTLPIRELRRIRGRRIGMVFQEPMSSLNPVLKAGEQVAEVARAHLGSSRREAWAKAEEMFARVGIPSPATSVHAYPHQLSGGMRQRVMIAMALVCGPELLVADEPTTALDVTVQAQILELVARLRRETGMAVLWISHDLAVVAQVADRITVAYAGKSVEDGPAGELLRNPLHPYTKALLACLPGAPLVGGRLPAIAGSVPAPGELVEGCRFRPRCGLAEEVCLEEPPLGSAGERRRSACHLWQELAEQESRA